MSASAGAKSTKRKVMSRRKGGGLPIARPRRWGDAAGTHTLIKKKSGGSVWNKSQRKGTYPWREEKLRERRRLGIAFCRGSKNTHPQKVGTFPPKAVGTKVNQVRLSERVNGLREERYEG